MYPRRFIITLLAAALLIGCAQATVLVITVTDASSGDEIYGASVYVNGDYIGTTDSDGEYSYYHTYSSSLTLKITKSGYEKYYDTVSYKATRADVELTRTSESLTVVVYDADTLLPVKSALVKITGEEDDETSSDVTDSSGEADFEVTTGYTYDVEILASNYETLTRTVEMGTGSKVVQYWLYRNDLFAILVTDEDDVPLEGATVSINGAVKGTTDSDGLVSLYLEREDYYDLEIGKDQYQTYEDELYIGVDDALLEVRLSKYLYSVTISVYDTDKVPIRGAEAVIDDESLGESDSYGRCGSTKLIAGTHTLTIRADGYKTYDKDFTLTDTSLEIAAELDYSDAILIITVEDDSHRVLPGAAVLIDGSSEGSTDAKGQMTASLPTSETYNVTAVLEGYESGSIDVDLPFGTAQQSVTITLQKNFDYGFVIVMAVIIGAVCIAAYLFLKRSRTPKRRPVKRSKL